MILIFSVNTNHESVAYRSFSPSKFEARGARKVTTGIRLSRIVPGPNAWLGSSSAIALAVLAVVTGVCGLSLWEDSPARGAGCCDSEGPPGDFLGPAGAAPGRLSGPQRSFRRGPARGWSLRGPVPSYRATHLDAGNSREVFSTRRPGNARPWSPYRVDG